MGVQLANATRAVRYYGPMNLAERDGAAETVSTNELSGWGAGECTKQNKTNSTRPHYGHDKWCAAPARARVCVLRNARHVNHNRDK